jgi:hypothetical protein
MKKYTYVGFASAFATLSAQTEPVKKLTLNLTMVS